MANRPPPHPTPRPIPVEPPPKPEPVKESLATEEKAVRAGEESEFDRLKREERRLRNSIKRFSAADGASRDDIYKDR